MYGDELGLTSEDEVDYVCPFGVSPLPSVGDVIPTSFSIAKPSAPDLEKSRPDRIEEVRFKKITI